VLRDIETGEQKILPTFGSTAKATPTVAGFTPLLSLEWKTLFGRLDAGFHGIEERIRLRAYELYEHHGRRDGHALDDWLQAEAELTERQSLRAAA